uniref:E3 ubiquitin-protein ligase HERC2 n=1 Tax=Nannochloropsis gaditana (strain CCMP526) TaxID=1093141 RepID=I2CP01_NANGC
MSYAALASLLLQAHREEQRGAREDGGGIFRLAHGRGPLSDKPALRGLSPHRLLARASLLRVLNQRLSRALPFLSLALPEQGWEREQAGASEPMVVETTYPLGSTGPRGGGPQGLERAQGPGVWQPACTARRLRALRKLVLTSTKRTHWETMLQATTTPTPLHQDEYEDPRDIKTIKINRVRASASRLASIRNMNERLRLSVFGQLHKEMRAWAHSSFRRAYLGKGHGGQKRAFKVRFLGEGVNDYGGPYRAIFEQVVDELQDDRHLLPLSAPSRHRPGGEKCLLPLLVPCPNRAGAVGPNQDKFVFSPGPPSPLALELMQLLGKMVGMALRHGLPMGLDLPATVWRPLVGLPLQRDTLGSLDVLAVKNLEQVERTAQVAEARAGGAGPEGTTASSSLVPEGWEEELTFSTHLSDGSLVVLPHPPYLSAPGGVDLEKEPARVTRANWQEYVRLVETVRLKESAAMMGAFQEGMAAVVPQELLPLFTEEEVEQLICGVREVDVELLRKCTDYEDGVDPDAPHVKAFWEVLEEMQAEERTDFLRFAWARSRMPASAKDFPMNFRLQGPQGGAKEKPDDYLPHAQTCFFSLSLPQYSSKEILREKLLLAISNSPNMDADVRLHTAEGWSET